MGTAALLTTSMLGAGEAPDSGWTLRISLNRFQFSVQFLLAPKVYECLLGEGMACTHKPSPKAEAPSSSLRARWHATQGPHSMAAFLTNRCLATPDPTQGSLPNPTCRPGGGTPSGRPARPAGRLRQPGRRAAAVLPGGQLPRRRQLIGRYVACLSAWCHMPSCPALPAAFPVASSPHLLAVHPAHDCPLSQEADHGWATPQQFARTWALRAARLQGRRWLRTALVRRQAAFPHPKCARKSLWLLCSAVRAARALP